jgi:hypothetical protein
MKNDKYDFQFGSEELDCLKRLLSSDEYLSALLTRNTIARGNGFSICLYRADSERLRSHLTEWLAHSGFNSDYSPTKQGEIVEDLIDRLYRP